MKRYEQMGSNTIGSDAGQQRVRTLRCGLVTAGAFFIAFCVIVPSATSRVLPERFSGVAYLGNSIMGSIGKGMHLGMRPVGPVAWQPGRLRSTFYPGGQLGHQGGFFQSLQVKWAYLQRHLSQATVHPVGGKHEEGLVEQVHSEEDLDLSLQSGEPGELLVLSVSTTWCGPCKVFAPTFQKFAAEYAGKARFVKMTADENASTNRLAMERLRVRAVPSVYFFLGGELVDTMRGVNEDRLRSKMEKHVIPR